MSGAFASVQFAGKNGLFVVVVVALVLLLLLLGHVVLAANCCRCFISLHCRHQKAQADTQTGQKVE